MSTYRVNIGTVANDGTGDTIRAAGQGINDALDEIDAADAAQDATLADHETRIGNVESVNTTQNATLASHTAGLSDHESRIDVLEAAPTPHSIPSGGTTGQVLKKTSNIDYAVAWEDETGGGGGGGGASAMTDLTDTNIVSPTEGDMLRFSGGKWVNEESPFVEGFSHTLPGSGTHRYWKFKDMHSAGANVSMNEVRFKATPGGTIVPVSAVTASSVYGSDPAYAEAHLIDGDLSTKWASAESGGSSSAWLIFDFGAPVSFEEIWIAARTDGFFTQAPDSFTLAWSDDGSAFTDLVSMAFSAWTANGQQQANSNITHLGYGLGIRDLVDYDDSVAPLDGQAVVWDAANSKFKPGSVAASSDGVVALLKDRVAPPNAAMFTTILGTNSVNPTFSNSSDGSAIFNFGISPASGDNNRVVLKALSAASWSIIARFSVSLFDYDYSGAGIYLRNSTSGKMTCWGPNGGGSNGLVQFNEWTNQASFSATPFAITPLRNNRWEWFKIDCDGTTMSLFVSNDGNTWLKCGERTLAAFMGSIDQVGFGMQVSHVHPYPNRTQDAQTQQYPWGPEGFIHVLYYSDPDIVPSAQTATVLVARSRNIGVFPPALADFPTTFERAQSGGIGSTVWSDSVGEGVVGLGPSANPNTASARMRTIPVDVSTTAFRFAARIKHIGSAGMTDMFSFLAAGTDDANFLMFGRLDPWSGDPNGRYYTAHFAGGTYHDDDYSIGCPIKPDWVSIYFDGAGNVLFQISLDGRNWLTVYSHTLSFFGFTPTKYGFGYKPYVTNGMIVIPAFFSDELPAPY